MLMHEIDNEFSNIPLSDLVHGIFGVLPGKTRHVLGNVIIKYMFKCISNIIGPGGTNKKEKYAYDALHQHLLNDASRQSKKDFPRMTMHGRF